jgi:hypothetical protein
VEALPDPGHERLHVRGELRVLRAADAAEEHADDRDGRGADGHVNGPEQALAGGVERAGLDAAEALGAEQEVAVLQGADALDLDVGGGDDL